MATARAIASGNWSATSTWNGGVLPGNGDTVYANGFTVTIDQNITIGGANNPIVNAGSFVSGQWYQITNVGSTSFTGIGAASNTVGTIFQASGVGSGSGQARARATLTTATNTAAGATSGGGFTLSSSYDIAADLRGGTTTVLTVSSSASTAISSGPIIIVPSANLPTISHAGTGTITITSGAILTSGNSGTNNCCVLISSSGNVILNESTFDSLGNGAPVQNLQSGTITVNQSNVIAKSSQYTQPNILNSGAGLVTLNSCTITGSSAANAFPAIVNSSAGSINVFNSTITAGSVNPAISNASSGSLICTNCTFTAVNGMTAISSTNASATNRFSGTFISSPNGTQPINATRWILNSSPTASYIQHALDGINANSFVRYYTADNALGQANPTDVRSGVSYASGNLTGRLTVPARGSVALSVNYGPSMPFTATCSGTTGTATLTYSYPLLVGDTITVTGASNSEWNSTYTIASVVSGTSVTFVVPNTHSATAGTGALMQTTGTAALDPAAVASAVWGAATRTLTAGAGITAADVWSHASRTITGGTVTTLTNAPSVPSAAAIASQVRTELSVELARVDAAITTRATPANIPAADITAIKAKTDAINVDRINNTATLSQVGNLLAQANS